MYCDFLAALNSKYRIDSPEQLTGIELLGYSFAASTRERGKLAVQLFEGYGFTMQGLRVSDVGCACGGFSIEAAKKGAIVYGVEIDKRLFT